jgi:hypothetical protein
MRTLKHPAFFPFILVLLAPALLHSAVARQPLPNIAVDSDQDGMSDALEQALLTQFAPTFMVGRHDCANTPARFAPNLEIPTVQAEDGTIYGQVFPAATSSGDLPTAEIHFYHLWARDCGPHGQGLDAEHVAVLVAASDRDLATARWKALYWYAAAHEDTVCDVSQIARASTIHAEQSGAAVFISPGKHASYLNEKLCQAGCGADKCVAMVALPRGAILNLGEAGHPMNSSVFIASSQWPLLAKMTNTNFPAEPLARLRQMPDTEIARFNPGRHPAQGIIATSGSTQRTIAAGAGNTTSSLANAGKSTGAALSTAQDNTGNALQKSCLSTARAVGVSARRLGEALHLVRKPSQPN